MNHQQTFLAAASVLAAALSPIAPAGAATTVQLGNSGKTFASDAVQCSVDQAGAVHPTVEAGLASPKRGTSGVVSLNGGFYTELTYANPVTTVVLAEGGNTVGVALSKKTADSYAFNVNAGQCSTAGNWVSADGTLEYAASGKSYATVTTGCALGRPFVNLFDNGTFVLNVSVNGVALTQLSATRPHTPVFLSAGWNLISAANGSLSTDHYVRNGGDGTCVMP